MCWSGQSVATWGFDQEAAVRIHMFLKTAIFTDTKELSIVFEMKHIVEGVLK
jgi:hypothetical protein